jgi:predicted house-cleaning noncanonical NTP pyrophosphatase (MazG superfamily)
MPTKNKLVRDLIPQIISNKGQKPITKVLNEEEYIKELDIKLKEELEEYLADDNCEELADMLEVIYAIAKSKGVSQSELESIRVKKFEERGGFDDKIYLISVES